MILEEAGHSPAFLCVSANPSAWILRYADQLEPDSEVLDLACGGGRHARLLLTLGHIVTLVDRDISGVADLGRNEHACLIEADLETDLEKGDWPLHGLSFDAVVVTNYLHRPLFPALLDSVRDGGLLLYETFAQGNERYGRPSNPDFLLRPGELRDLLEADFDILAFEDLQIDQPRPAVIQHIAARKTSS